MGTNAEALLSAGTVQGKCHHQSGINSRQQRRVLLDDLDTALRASAFQRMPEPNESVIFQCWYHIDHSAYIYIDPDTLHVFMADNGRLISSEPNEILEYLHDLVQPDEEPQDTRKPHQTTFH